VRIPDGDERKRSPLGGDNARTSGYHYNDGREERQKREGPAVIAGPSQSAVKFGVAFRSFGT
jgi:hypothetical protein